MKTDVPVFGNRLSGVEYVQRPGAYALIPNSWGELALVEGHQGAFFFPGGGSDPGESLADTLIRELREELAWQVSVGAVLGAAIQYIVADGGTHFELQQTYFLASQIGSFDTTPEHTLIWRTTDSASRLLHRPCDVWAVSKFTALFA